jgi:hypothetical protein
MDKKIIKICSSKLALIKNLELSLLRADAKAKLLSSDALVQEK